MGSKISKIIGDKIRLATDAPKYAKDFSKEMLYILMRLFEEYKYRFCYGISGLNTPYVEMFGPDKVLEELTSVLPYKSEEDCSAIVNMKKRVYDDQSCNLKKIIWRLNRDECKEFFSIFNHFHPQLDRYWMHKRQEPSKFIELTQKEIEEILYGDKEQRTHAFGKAKDRLLGKKNSGLLMTRNISVLFGDYGLSEKLGMKLVYYKNARPESESGLLRMYFYYYTYDDSVIVHSQLCVHKKLGSIKKRKKDNLLEEIEESSFDEEEKELERRKIELDIIEYEKREKERLALYLPNGELKPEVLERLQREDEERRKNRPPNLQEIVWMKNFGIYNP